MAPRAKKGRFIGYDDPHGRIYFIYLPAEDKVTRVNAVKFHEASAQAPNGDADLEYEAVLDDPGLTEEYLPGTRVHFSDAIDVINPKPTQEPGHLNSIPTPSPDLAHSIPLPSLDLAHSIPLPSPILTPEPGHSPIVLDEIQVEELPDDYEGQGGDMIAIGDGTHSDSAQQQTTGYDDDVMTDDQDGGEEQPLEMERPLLDVTSATSEAQVSGPRRSERQSRKPDGFYRKLASGNINEKDPLVYMHKIDDSIRRENDNSEPPPPDHCVSLVQAMKLSSPHIDIVPQNFRQARKRDDYYERWLPAMKRQMDQLENLKTCCGIFDYRQACHHHCRQ
jgi:hypothetical protein